MDQWKKSFSQKVGSLQASWVKQFDEALDASVTPVFKEMAEFLDENGFRTTIPLREKGRRSFKFELAEDAYLLMIFSSNALGAFDLSCESLVPGGEPDSYKEVNRVSDLNRPWALKRMQTALDAFIDRIGGGKPVEADEELVVV